MDDHQVSKKRKFVIDNRERAELNELFERIHAENGYAGCDIRKTSGRLEIVIRATNTKDIVGPSGARMNELRAIVCKKLQLPQEKVHFFAEAVAYRGLCAVAQAENLKFKLLQGLPVRRAAHGIMRQIMSAGAKGCEVIISGKMRGARAKSMKFNDGFMVHSGNPCRDYIATAVRHVPLRQGMLGVKVKIMLDHDPNGRRGPAAPLPDHIVVLDAKEEELPATFGVQYFLEEVVQPDAANAQKMIESV